MKNIQRCMKAKLKKEYEQCYFEGKVHNNDSDAIQSVGDGQDCPFNSSIK
jgi:hypothetical protein